MRRAVALFVVLVLVVQVAAVPATGVSTDETILRTTSLSLTPDEPGSVEAAVTYDVPSNVLSLTTTVPESATVLSTDGFERTAGGNYTWDGRGGDPSLTLALSTNRTGVGLRDLTPAATMESGYRFVDTGPWAVVASPRMSTKWRSRGSVTFESRLETSGEGVAGERMVYLGPSSTYRRTASGQTFELVVPDAATLGEEPTAILDALEFASQSLRVGERDPTVTIIVAPTSVDWAAQGLASDADAWVRADRDLDDANNVWIHEYVHTRADFQPTEDARWLSEATAEYYAALVTLEQGRIGFDEFASHLRQGGRSPFDSSVLTRPDTWTRGANYLKGALVLGDLDYRLRSGSGGSDSAAVLFSRMNARDGAITHGFVIDVVSDVDGETAANTLDRYASTTAAPEMWTQRDHADAFSNLPARMVVTLDGPHRVSGPFRNATVEPIPTVVTGETVTVNATVTNTGGVPGTYEVPVAVDGTTEEIATGSLDGGDSREIQFDTTFHSPGTHTVRIGTQTLSVTVDRPARPAVTAVRVADRTTDSGTPLTVSLTATNDADRPATGDVPIAVDGTTVTTWRPVLDVGESVTVNRSVVLDGPGVHTISAGNRSVEVTVRAVTTGSEPTSSPVTGSRTTDSDTPGFTPAVVVVAMVSVAIALWRSRRPS